MATSSKDKTVRIWNINNQKCVALCRGHTDAVSTVTFSKNTINYINKTRYLISGSNDKILQKRRCFA